MHLIIIWALFFYAIGWPIKTQQIGQQCHMWMWVRRMLNPKGSCVWPWGPLKNISPGKESPEQIHILTMRNLKMQKYLRPGSNSASSRCSRMKFRRHRWSFVSVDRPCPSVNSPLLSFGAEGRLLSEDSSCELQWSPGPWSLPYIPSVTLNMNHNVTDTRRTRGQLTCAQQTHCTIFIFKNDDA